MTDEPKRIQLSRARGWRKPAGAIVVARPSKWGNPFKVKPHPTDGGWMVQGGGRTIWGCEQEDGAYRALTKADCQEIAVDMYRGIHPSGSAWSREAEIHLGGHDLACWCPVGSPCHADYLLELANR